MRSKQPDSAVHCCIIFVLERLPGLECFGPRSCCSPGFVLSCICLKLVLVQKCPLPLVSYGLSSFFVSDLFQKHMMRNYTVWSDLGTRSGQLNPTGPRRRRPMWLTCKPWQHQRGLLTIKIDTVPLASAGTTSISRVGSCCAAIIRRSDCSATGYWQADA